MDHEAIKTLRMRTQAGVLACKKALDASHGDIDEAERLILRETKQKTGRRVASKGMIRLAIENNQIIVFEINGETDFIVKHDSFIHLFKKIEGPLMQSDAMNAEEANHVLFDSHTVKEEVLRTGKIVDEHLELRRFYRIEKETDQMFGSYDHQGKVIGLVVLSSGSPELARDLAMQIVSQGSDISDDHKTENAKNTLLGLPYVKDPEKTVADVLSAQGALIDRFYRFELGQGIEDKLVCRLDLPCDASTIKIP